MFTPRCGPLTVHGFADATEIQLNRFTGGVSSRQVKNGDSPETGSRMVAVFYVLMMAVVIVSEDAGPKAGPQLPRHRPVVPQVRLRVSAASEY